MNVIVKNIDVVYKVLRNLFLRFFKDFMILMLKVYEILNNGVIRRKLLMLIYYKMF